MSPCAHTPGDASNASGPEDLAFDVSARVRSCPVS